MGNPVNTIIISGSQGNIYVLNNCTVSLNVKKCLNDVGTFNFSLPSLSGSTSIYTGASLNNYVKIWMDYDVTGSTPTFMGRLGSIGNSVSETSIRSYSGKDLGEVLDRRLKTKRWIATDAWLIAIELANELGMDSGYIDSDTNDVTLQVENKKYSDVMRILGEYWINSTTQVNKDFYGEYNANNSTGSLKWKTRPIRTVGVETLTTGSNIINYSVVRNINEVYNKITQYGFKNKSLPTGGDEWTETYSGSDWTWTKLTGTILYTSSAFPQCGARQITCTSAFSGVGDDWATIFKWTGSAAISPFVYENLNFYARTNYPATIVTKTVRLLAPDTSNYFEAVIPSIHNVADANKWDLNSLAVGPTEDYNAITNPNAVWNSGALGGGTPNWEDIRGIEFYITFDAGDGTEYVNIDGVHFNLGYFSNTSEDSTSQAAYGIREIVYSDDRLRSDAECESRAKALLSQKKDPPVQLTILMTGSKNVFIGDRITMNLPAENINNLNFDVIQVEHSMSPQFYSTVTMGSVERQRTVIPRTPAEVLLQVKSDVSSIKKSYVQPHSAAG